MRRTIVWDARHHHEAPNGRVHLSSQVVHLDTHQPIYRRRRRPRTFAELTIEFTFRFVVPVLLFTLFALSLIGAIWLILAVGRWVARMGGGLA